MALGPDDDPRTWAFVLEWLWDKGQFLGYFLGLMMLYLGVIWGALRKLAGKSLFWASAHNRSLERDRALHDQIVADVTKAWAPILEQVKFGSQEINEIKRTVHDMSDRVSWIEGYLKREGGD